MNLTAINDGMSKNIILKLENELNQTQINLVNNSSSFNITMGKNNKTVEWILKDYATGNIDSFSNSTPLPNFVTISNGFQLQGNLNL